MCGLLIILASALWAQGLDNTTSWIAHRNLAKQVGATDAARVRQYAHETRLTKQLDDSLPKRLPAQPQLY